MQFASITFMLLRYFILCVCCFNLSMLFVSCQPVQPKATEVIVPVVIKPLTASAYLLDVEKKLQDSILPAGITFERNEQYLLLIIQGNLLFDIDKFDFRYEAVKVIDPLANILIKFPPAAVDIKSYTDSLGPLSWNQRLSEYRAKALQDYLTTAGLSTDLVKAAGFGSQNPIESNSSELGRQANRRLEVRIFPIQP